MPGPGGGASAGAAAGPGEDSAAAAVCGRAADQLCQSDRGQVSAASASTAVLRLRSGEGAAALDAWGLRLVRYTACSRGCRWCSRVRCDVCPPHAGHSSHRPVSRPTASPTGCTTVGWHPASAGPAAQHLPLVPLEHPGLCEQNPRVNSAPATHTPWHRPRPGSSEARGTLRRGPGSGRTAGALLVHAPWPEASGLVHLRGQARSLKRWARVDGTARSSRSPGLGAAFRRPRMTVGRDHVTL